MAITFSHKYFNIDFFFSSSHSQLYSFSFSLFRFFAFSLFRFFAFSLFRFFAFSLFRFFAFSPDCLFHFSRFSFSFFFSSSISLIPYVYIFPHVFLKADKGQGKGTIKRQHCIIIYIVSIDWIAIIVCTGVIHNYYLLQMMVLPLPLD